MKVMVTVNTEVMADVSVDDVFAEICSLPDGDRVTSMLTAVSTAHSVLTRIPDEMIGKMSDEHRVLIGNALAKEAQRYGVREKLNTEGNLI